MTQQSLVGFQGTIAWICMYCVNSHTDYFEIDHLESYVHYPLNREIESTPHNLCNSISTKPLDVLHKNRHTQCHYNRPQKWQQNGGHKSNLKNIPHLQSKEIIIDH